MKKNYVLAFLVLLVCSVLAQAPAGVSYQTVVRDVEGLALANTTLSLKMTIRSGSVSGEVVYSETHQAVTNAFGLVSLKLGMGTPENGVFSEIQWNTSDYFLETAIDLAGNGEYQVMGVSQFLSVPYALNAGYSNLAGGTPAMTTDERNDIEDPFIGMQIYNTDTKCLNYFSGTTWYSLCGECEPPNLADAGTDQTDITEVSVTLAANEPENGIGTWVIAGGNYGSFEDSSDPTALFSGYTGETYHLIWTISNDCGTSSDTVMIGFAGEKFECGQDFTDYRDGKVYGTVLYENQCWMTKNMNLGTQVDGHTYQTDNGIVEKYCYDNNDDFCILHGALYQWDEMMQYSTEEGAQGICPAGWHIPTDYEWTTLTNYISSEESYRCNFDPDNIARALAADKDWLNSFTLCAPGRDTYDNNATNFTGLAAGRVFPDQLESPFSGILEKGVFWSSTFQESIGKSWTRELNYDNPMVYRYSDNLDHGLAARCINDVGSVVFTLTLEVSPENAGTVTGAGQYEPYTSINIVATANPNWNFVSWTYNGEVISDLASYYIEMPDENITITANFEDASPGFDCGEEFTDPRDNQVYPTVQIGDQCWMAKNLNIGTQISGISEPTDNDTIEKYCYDNLASNCEIYGGLYQWNELMEYSTEPGGMGICPVGWHVPEEGEWDAMRIFLSYQQQFGGALKETGTTHWQSPNSGATNSTGFTALPGGSRDDDGQFSVLGKYSFMLTSSLNPDFNNWPSVVNLYYNDTLLKFGASAFYYGYSVRCLKGETTMPYLNITPENLEVGPPAGTAIINVSSNVAWNVEEDISWLTALPGNGSNDGVFVVNYTQNANPDSRSGQITVQSNDGEVSAILTIVQEGTGNTLVCGDPFTDERDGQTYNTVLIGEQCWMAKNLNYGTKINNTTNISNNGITEKYCYNNQLFNCVEYGGLYKWDEMMQYTSAEGTKGICPEEYHLPTLAEYMVLFNYLGGASQAGGAMKEAGFIHWASPNAGATNSSGFTALPGGFMQTYGTFEELGSLGDFWTSSALNVANSSYLALSSIAYDAYTTDLDKSFALSVRCIKDGSATSLLDVTPDNQNVNYEAGTTTFEVTSNVTWTVDDEATWLSVSPIWGTGNQTVTVTYDANTEISTRTGYINFEAEGGVFTKTVTVTQVGYSPTFCGVEFLDTRNGEIYPTVKIGNQCWFAKNLNVGELVQEYDPQTDNNTIEKYCHENYLLNCQEYGGLYLWDEMMNYSTTPGVQGICPGGWHIPTDNEWTTLEEFLGGPDIAGGKLKENGFDHWIEPNTGATNTSGFTALPGGTRAPSGFVGSPGYSGNWWSSTQLYDPSLVWYRYLYYSHGISSRYSETKDNGYSVRCLKDE
jgi:uncharacterized protein (TIGR02145 family)